MESTINSQKLSRKSGIIYVDPTYKTEQKNLTLLRVILCKEETRIEFGYNTANYYYRGGWVTISPTTFIQAADTSNKLIITGAENIPYGPQKHFFKSTNEWIFFSLIFPALPIETRLFHLIENENGTPNDFNFWHIDLSSKANRFLLY